MTDNAVTVTPNETEVVANPTTTVVVASTPGGASIVESFEQVAVAAPEVIVVSVSTDGAGGAGGDPAGTAAALMDAHESAADPHPQYLTDSAAASAYLAQAAFTWGNIGGKPTTFAGFGVTLLAGDIPALSWSKITSGKPTTLAGYGITDAVPTSQKGAANGVAPLGADGKIPAAYVSAASAVGQVEYKGTWNASAGTPPTASPQKGWYFVTTVAGTTNLSGITDWKVGDWAIYNGTAWDKVDNTDAIPSWNGRTGAIVPAANDYTFAQIGSKPTTLAGYGITDAVAAAAFTWANLGSKPSTVAGFGITDAVTDDEVDANASVNTIAKRNASGDIFMRLPRTTYPNESGMSGGLVFRIDNAGNNYLRVCSSPIAIRSWLGFGSDAARVSVDNGTDGLIVGAYTSAGYGAIYHSADVPGSNNYALACGAGNAQVFMQAATKLNFRAGGSTQFDIDGNDMRRKNASSTGMSRIPRIFVQQLDPGGAADDGDLWLW